MTRRALCTAALALALAGPVLAQRQGGPGGFGRGGFGMMGLLFIPEVQKELKVTEPQLLLIQGLAEQQRAGGRERFQGLRDLPEAEREERMAAMRAEQDKKVAEILDKN